MDCHVLLTSSVSGAQSLAAESRGCSGCVLCVVLPVPPQNHWIALTDILKSFKNLSLFRIVTCACLTLQQEKQILNLPWWHHHQLLGPWTWGVHWDENCTFRTLCPHCLVDMSHLNKQKHCSARDFYYCFFYSCMCLTSICENLYQGVGTDHDRAIPESGVTACIFQMRMKTCSSGAS